jgi:hypothetical protein
MSISTILDNLSSWLIGKGFNVVIEPTTPIDAHQVAIFFTKANVEDAAYPNRYKITASIEVVFVENNYTDCLEKINNIIQNITPSVLGKGVIVSVLGVETREKEEGEPYYAMALLLAVTYFGSEI